MSCSSCQCWLPGAPSKISWQTKILPTSSIHRRQLRSDQDLSYPMLLRTHILPGLAEDCVRDVAPQKAMKMEKSRRSFILMQDAWLLGS